MAQLRENSITRLATVSSVDMKTAGATTLYTVAVSKSAVITHVVIRALSASLAGGTDYNFGGNSSDFNDFRDAVNLSGITGGATVYTIVTQHAGGNVVSSTLQSASDNFSINVVTGSTAACTATIDVYGYLV